MSQVARNNNGEKMLIVIGGNVPSAAGGPLETVKAGLAALRAHFVDVRVSGLYQTPSFPAGSGPDFINAACTCQTDMTPYQVLQTLHEVEAAFGRERKLRWGTRTLDLDLIACGAMILPDVATQTAWRDLPLEAQKTQTPDTLILPHPRIQDRGFVLVPLADVAPDWVHPLLHRSVAEMLDDLPDAERAQITRL